MTDEITIGNEILRRVKMITFEEEPEVEEESQVDLLPEGMEVTTHLYTRIYTMREGVLYQRCGGGKRVIRKRLGRS